MFRIVPCTCSQYTRRIDEDVISLSLSREEKLGDAAASERKECDIICIFDCLLVTLSLSLARLRIYSLLDVSLALAVVLSPVQTRVTSVEKSSRQHSHFFKRFDDEGCFPCRRFGYAR